MNYVTGRPSICSNFYETRSRNMPLINNFLFLLVVTFSIGYVCYFSIKLKIKRKITQPSCFSQMFSLTTCLYFCPACLPHLSVDPYTYSWLLAQFAHVLQALLYVLDISALPKQKHEFQVNQKYFLDIGCIPAS